MLDLNPFINAFRKLGSIKTRTPPVSVVALGIMDESTGTMAAYVDPVTHALFGSTKLPFNNAQSLRPQTTISATGAVALTIQNQTYVFGASGVVAATLAAPTAAQAGTRIFCTSNGAHAHTITATSLLNNGLTGVPFTTVTFAAFAGAGIELEAVGLLWNVVSNVACTLS